MIRKNSNKIWSSVSELGETLQKNYSVTGKREEILEQYPNQVKQYPLYRKWFEIISKKLPKNKKIDIIEYGSGHGFLAEKIIKNHKIGKYIVVEPEKTFREMTFKKTGKRALVFNSIAEKFISKESVDFVIMTATYHHIYNKLKAMKNIYKNLKKGGKLIMGDALLPKYPFDKKYNPKNKLKFTKSVINYAAEQIRSMPNPKNEDVADQIKTTILDILRIEELKVCAPILRDQLKKTGFKNIKIKMMKSGLKSINDYNLGYYIAEAEK